MPKRGGRGPSKSYRRHTTPTRQMLPTSQTLSPPRPIEELEQLEPIAAKKKRLYDEKKKKDKYHGFGDPNWSDIKSDEQ